MFLNGSSASVYIFIRLKRFFTWTRLLAAFSVYYRYHGSTFTFYDFVPFEALAWIMITFLDEPYETLYSKSVDLIWHYFWDKLSQFKICPIQYCFLWATVDQKFLRKSIVDVQHSIRLLLTCSDMFLSILCHFRDIPLLRFQVMTSVSHRKLKLLTFLDRPYVSFYWTSVDLNCLSVTSFEKFIYIYKVSYGAPAGQDIFGGIR